jgi:hypothetical protein
VKFKGGVGILLALPFFILKFEVYRKIFASRAGQSQFASYKT